MISLNRREFLAAGSAVVADTLINKKVDDHGKKQPNVLVIFTDEQSLWTLSAFGGQLPGTPNIDSIGREGAVFENFFVTSAVCTPSRGCYMTGQYPHSNGAYKNDEPLHTDSFTLGNMFQNAGYETGYAGKWHLDGNQNPVLPGWLPADRAFGFADHQWMYNTGHWKRIVERPAHWPENRGEAVFSGKFDISAHDGHQDIGNLSPTPDGRPNLSYYVSAPGEYMTDWLCDKAIEYIRRPRSAPFFYFLSLPDPHSPFEVREPYASAFPRKKMILPETFFQKNLPPWAEAMRKDDVKREHVSDEMNPERETIFRERMAIYLGMVKCIDDNVGRILNTLRELHILDDTLIMFASDHGQYMGEHGIYFKNGLYEAAHHVGVMMRWPQGIRPGTIVKECVANVDILPTLAGLLNLRTSGKEQGTDASDLLRGDSKTWKDEAFIHKDNSTQAGIFTQEWEFALVKGGGSVLFDRKNDFKQARNLFDDPKYAPVVKIMTERVLAHNEALRTPALEWLRTTHNR